MPDQTDQLSTQQPPLIDITTDRDLFYAQIRSTIMSLTEVERLYVSVHDHRVYTAISFKEIQERMKGAAPQLEPSQIVCYTIGNVGGGNVQIALLSQNRKREEPISTQVGEFIMSTLGLDQPIPAPRKGFVVLSMARGRNEGQVLLYCPDREYAEKRFETMAIPRSEVLVTEEEGYQPPSLQPWCQCKQNPLRQQLCPYGHLLECHFPLTCNEAWCGHAQSEDINDE